MKSFTEMKKETEADQKEVYAIKEKITKLEEELFQTKWTLESKERILAEKNVVVCQVMEIFRLARYQFSRLRNKPQADLTPADIAELDKWISRIKTNEGLNTVKQAIKELDKYSPSEIKSNLYALVQKIIIGGAYSQGKKA